MIWRNSLIHLLDARHQVARELERDAALELLVKAFADAREAAPDTLSTRRATIVVEWLSRRGIDAGSLTRLSCGLSGHSRPEGPAPSAKQNRRAELVRRTSTAGCEPPW